MTDFVLGKLKFTFKGAWVPTTVYSADDIVRYGGNSYVCKINHTASSGNNFFTDLNNGKWDVITSGTDWKGDWQTSTYYKVNDVVKYGGTIYVANTGHVSNISTNYGLEADYNKWVTYGATPYWLGNWSSNTRYRTNDLVQYGGSLYLVTAPHFSNGNSLINAWTTNESNVTLYVGGLEFEDTYNPSTVYNVGDVVRYGGYNFICIEDSVNNIPTNVTYWKVLSTGFKHRGDYSNLTAYEPGDVIRYGPGVYVAKQNTTGNVPTLTAYWDLLSQGNRWTGEYAANSTYAPGDLVQYGGYLYSANATTTGNAPSLATVSWNVHQAGIKWNGIWNSSNTYQLGDIVNYANSSFISTSLNNSNVAPGDIGSSGYWEVVAQGSYDTYMTTPGDLTYRSNVGMTRLGIGSIGQVLTSDGLFPIWADSGATANVFYVAPEGIDDGVHGKSKSAPFKTIKYACSNAPAGATIFVAAGVYEEQLPIVVKSNTAVVGDSQRTVKVLPIAGLSDDGINQNMASTMWQLSDGAILNKMTFGGMTGWVPGGTPDDITTSTMRAVVVGFNPASPITHKSPYVLECAAICSKAIGALVDGSAHGSGNRSMIFHGYTCIMDDGVGYYVRDNGKAEIVSCFTYYCYFGYATSGGGYIRALNGNNSYGKWGASSRGFNTNESPVTGNIFGRQVNVVIDGNAIAGDTITGPSGNAIITNVQASANKVYVSNILGTFSYGEAVTFTSGGTGTVSSGGLEDQQGFILVLDNLSANPKPGASISIAGDNVSYVVQSVSGTYVGANSIIAVVLAQEKATGSPDNAHVNIRYEYSQIRLTGHDFLNIGTGNVLTTNYPGAPITPAAQGNEVDENFPGRVFYVSTDQDGNFRVGEYFRIDQATGRATLNASAFDLAGLTSLKLGSIGAQLGETINEFSSDVTMSGNSNQAVPTEYAVRSFVNTTSAALTTATTSNINTLKFVTYVNQII